MLRFDFMSGFREATQAMAGGTYRSPKTVLGFFAILIGILASAAVVVIGVLARVAALHYLILPILLFVAAVIVFSLLGVFVTAWKDPTILMLWHVTGEIYIENSKLTLGDSSAGE